MQGKFSHGKKQLHAKSKDKWQTGRKYYIYITILKYMYVFEKKKKNRGRKRTNVPNIKSTLKNKETKKPGEKQAKDMKDNSKKNYKNGP